MKPIIRLHPVVPSYHQFSSSLFTSPVSNSSSNEDENEYNQNDPQQQLELNRSVRNDYIN